MELDGGGCEVYVRGAAGRVQREAKVRRLLRGGDESSGERRGRGLRRRQGAALGGRRAAGTSSVIQAILKGTFFIGSFFSQSGNLS